MDRTERFYRIDQLLKSGARSFAELQRSLGISRAQLKRDLAYMREQLNAPIEYDRDSNGYRFGKPLSGPRYELPGLWFSAAEMHALLGGSRSCSEKMELDYNYNWSPQFAQRVRTVVEGFEELRLDLQKERDAMTRIWENREAQLTRMTTSMLSMVGGLQVIGQGAVGRLENLAVLLDLDVSKAESAC